MEWNQLPGIPLCHQVEEPNGHRDKRGIGCSPSHRTTSLHTCPAFAHSSEGNSKGVNLGFCTGSSLLRSRQSNLSSEYVESLAPSTPSPPGRPPQLTTSGKMRRMSTGRGLNSGSSRSKGTTPITGMKSGNLQKSAELNPLIRKSEFVIIGLCEQYALITQNQLEWSELATYSGVRLGLVKVAPLGREPVCRLMLKIPYPNFGNLKFIQVRLQWSRSCCVR